MLEDGVNKTPNLSISVQSLSVPVLFFPSTSCFRGGQIEDPDSVPIEEGVHCYLIQIFLSFEPY